MNTVPLGIINISRQTVWFGEGNNSTDTCNTSGASIVNDQPLAGINGDCAPNDSTGVFPEITETVCQVSPAILNNVISCLQVNSFTQPDIANNIPNPAP